MEKTASLSMRPSLPDSPQFSHSLSKLGLFFNEHIEGDGPTVFAHAWQAWPRRHYLEAQGFRLPFRPLDWLKMKNSDAPAVKHEEEEDWAKKKGR